MVNNYLIDVGTFALVYVILGLGLNIVVGYAGLLDLGYAAFFAIGAYTTALLMVRAHVSFWATLPIAAILVMCSGVVIGGPTLRLRSDYLAIVTLGFGEIVRIAATNLEFTGGPEGVWAIPRPRLLGMVLASPVELYYLALAFALVAVAGSYALAASRVGRAWLAIREDETAAAAVGIDLIWYKLLAYVLGALWGGLAGAYFAVKLSAINPTSFTFIVSVNILMAVILGGMASVPGVLIGALLVVAFPELLRHVAFGEENRFLFFGIALIILMLIRPQGLWPSRLGRVERARVRASIAGISEEAEPLPPGPEATLPIERSG